MSQEGSRRKVAPFLSKNKNVHPREADFLDFLRLNYQSPELNKKYGDGLSNYFFDQLSRLMRIKNTMIDNGEVGKEFDDIIYRMSTIEMFIRKYEEMIKAYDEWK